jgi:hypothetical protein
MWYNSIQQLPQKLATTTFTNVQQMAGTLQQRGWQSGGIPQTKPATLRQEPTCLRLAPELCP